MSEVGGLSVILHGGVGKSNAGAEQRSAVMTEALDAAWQRLERGEAGEQAVVDALAVLEASDLFNAGYGSAVNEHGQVRCDVGLMRGNGDFIAFTNIPRIIHPSRMALDRFKPGMRLFRTWTADLMKSVEEGTATVKKHYGLVQTEQEMVASAVLEDFQKSRAGDGKDTVGCVVRDKNGNLFSGTSTGGVRLKPEGRIGDCPIVGAGVFAQNGLGGLSATGDGEAILQSCLSGYILAGMRSGLACSGDTFADMGQRLGALVGSEIDRANTLCPGMCFGMIVMPPSGPPIYGCNDGYRLPMARRYRGSDGSLRQDIGIFDKPRL